MTDTGAPSAGGGTLYVVATPIGNLADLTLRAIETLRAVPLVAAEDTRHTHRLLERHAIPTRTTSFHARSGPGRLEALLVHLRGGDDLALVTDAGTPAVSDPGADLVVAWAAEGGSVVPIPGASAVLAAVVASAVVGPRWSFEGFLPRKGRGAHLTTLAREPRTMVFFESPNRLPAALKDLVTALGPERRVVVCRELTKLHEEIVRVLAIHQRRRPVGRFARLKQKRIAAFSHQRIQRQHRAQHQRSAADRTLRHAHQHALAEGLFVAARSALVIEHAQDVAVKHGGPAGIFAGDAVHR